MANLKPSKYLLRMREHDKDVSVGSKSKIMAKRTILNREVTFYENGLRIIDDEDELSEEDQFNSEVLRLAHASILINDAVGDKRACYVDARVNPVIVFVYGMKADDFVAKAKQLIKSGTLKKDFVLDSPIQELRNVRNVGLSRRPIN
jgi:hypothetical protein